MASFGREDSGFERLQMKEDPDRFEPPPQLRFFPFRRIWIFPEMSIASHEWRGSRTSGRVSLGGEHVAAPDAPCCYCCDDPCES